MGRRLAAMGTPIWKGEGGEGGGGGGENRNGGGEVWRMEMVGGGGMEMVEGR